MKTPTYHIALSDGTWQKLDQEHPTNIAKLYNLLVQDEEQNVYYDPGVGSGFVKLIPGAIGAGLRKNVRDLYTQIVQGYTPGDKIVTVGFSRGGKTARTLGGMICAVGIVKDVKDVKKAWKQYRERVRHLQPYEVHRDSYHVHFICTADVVGAIGVPGLGAKLPWNNGFHDLNIHDRVDGAYAGYAIHENRKAFRETRMHSTRPEIVEEWYEGGHADVGGGNGNDERSNIWLQEAVARLEEAGLRFDRATYNRPAYMKVSYEAPIKLVGKWKLWLSGGKINRSVIGEEVLFHKSVRPAARARLKVRKVSDL